MAMSLASNDYNPSEAWYQNYPTGGGSTGNLNQPRPFFSNNNSTMDNIGQVGSLLGGGISLISMLQQMSDARKNNALNRSGLRQQMGQSRTAFNRDVARQDASLAALAQAYQTAQL